MFPSVSKLIFFLTTLLFSVNLWAQNTNSAIVLDIDGAIGPATQNYIENGLTQAAQQDASLVILQLDTPGGLDKAMRNIVRAISTSPIPVISYVTPSGARAASAGTYILYASTIAAMTPGTNLGAATPVSLGLPNKNNPADTHETKAINDAAAYLRSLAQLHKRNAQWAEDAVRQSASLSADEALKSKVIEVIAKDVPDLLTKLNGRTVTINDKKITLHTNNLTVQYLKPNWHARLLSIITDPNIAYLLLIGGIWCLFLEFSHPGFMLPGVVGAISILIALYAFQLLPINYAGLALILLGVAFMIGEVFLPTFGALGIGGVIAFVIGSILLLGSATPGYEIALPLIIGVSIVSAVFFLFIAGIALKARHRPIVSGREELVGHTTIVLFVDKDQKAWARLKGELWQVRASTPLLPGQKITIRKVEGMALIVEVI